MKKTAKKIIAWISVSAAAIGSIIGVSVYAQHVENQEWERQCDGVSITSKCTADENIRYKKYVFHEAQAEVTETIEHPAEPAKTHIEHHDAVYGTRSIRKCRQTTISYKHGTCALTVCRDGELSGSSGRGTCSYHGGVAYGGGPWYYYEDETYLVTPAWDETIVDVPAKDAWTETKVVTPAREAYYEKVPA